MINLEIRIPDDDYQLMPFRANPTDAGLDLRSQDTVTLPPLMTNSIILDTGVQVKIPEGCVGLVFARSSSIKTNIRLTNCVGVIDSDYRGTIKVGLINGSRETREINKYDRIAQLVILPIPQVSITLVNTTNEDWVDTKRGLGGLGSSGKQ